jgi:signal transduction histidine kinase
MSVVLLVDDSPSDRVLFRTILSRGGFTVHEVGYGRDVPAALLEVRPVAVVLDVNLPDGDGHAVCRALRADPINAGLPVLMLTVRDDDRDIVAGLEAGADDYVAKDAPGEVVLARVRRLVRDRQMSRLAVLNDQLVQVGRLLAGIVHEIRGPLSVIRGNAEMMQMSLGAGHETARWIEPILRNAQVLQVRLEHLMAAVRAGPIVLKPVELPGLIREASDLFLRGLDSRRGKLEIETTCDPALPPVLGDSGRLIQVILNLLSNAQDAAMDGRAACRVRIEACRDDDTEMAGPWVRVTIADDGPGIPDAFLSRVFEPFFTTKPSGSGYGLYLSSEILREHGGRLTACNGPRGGACFSLWLPPVLSP